MRRFIVSLTGVVLVSLVVVQVALAVHGGPHAPAVPVGAYGDSLLTALGSAVADVFPYAAAITAFAIGVGLVRRWLGARKATKV
jgi:hypothetical protein